MTPVAVGSYRQSVDLPTHSSFYHACLLLRGVEGNCYWLQVINILQDRHLATIIATALRLNNVIVV